MRVVRACPGVIYEASCNFWDCFQPRQLAQNASEAMVGLSMPLTGMMTSLEGLWHLRKRDTICRQAEVHPLWHQQMLEIISVGSSSQIFSVLAGGGTFSFTLLWHSGRSWPLRMGSMGLICLYTWIHSYLSTKDVSAVSILMSKWPFILATCVSLWPPHGSFYFMFTFSLENKYFKYCCFLLCCLCLLSFILGVKT